MKKGIFVISTPKWKVREYVRIAIGIIGIIIFTALIFYSHYYLRHLEIEFLSALFN